MSKSPLPPNVQKHLQLFSPRSTGHPRALEHLELSLDDFTKSRQQNYQLKRISVLPYIDQNGLECEQVLVIQILGRKNTYYHHKKLTFFMMVGDRFPEEPPEIVVGQVREKGGMYRPFLHLNFDHTGHVCMLSNQPGKEYYKHTSLTDLLIELQNTIYNPNISSSYPSVLYENYSTTGSNQQYFKLLNAQAELLPPVEEDEMSDEEQEENEEE